MPLAVLARATTLRRQGTATGRRGLDVTGRGTYRDSMRVLRMLAACCTGLWFGVVGPPAIGQPLVDQVGAVRIEAVDAADGRGVAAACAAADWVRVLDASASAAVAAARRSITGVVMAVAGSASLPPNQAGRLIAPAVPITATPAPSRAAVSGLSFIVACSCVQNHPGIGRHDMKREALGLGLRELSVKPR